MKLLLHFLLVLASAEAYKILVYSPFFGHSHMKFMGSIADTLTDAGHDVTVLMGVFDPISYSERKTALKTTKKIIFTEPHEKIMEMNATEIRKEVLGAVWAEDKGVFGMIGMINRLKDMFLYSCEAILSDKELLQRLRDEKFDVGVVEPFYLCGFGILEAIGLEKYVSAVAASRMDHVSYMIGEPSGTSFVPAVQSSFSDQMTLLERLQNTINFFLGNHIFGYIGDKEYEVVRKNLPEARDWRQLLPESTFVFVNKIDVLDYPTPTLNKVVSIGGIAVNTKRDKTNQLEQKWEKILSERSRTVLISFGSNARSVDMPEPFKAEMVELFKSMPETTFIWKYEDESSDVVKGIPNVHISEWVPQNELLADPRLTVFVTHGGMASITELVSFGKPSVTIPLFADQPKNAKMLARHGGSITIDKAQLSDHRNIKNALESIFNEKKYSENAKRLGEIINNQPTDPKETLVKYVEFTARFGKQPHMDAYGRHLNIFQYYLIDALALVVVTVATVIYILFKLTKFVCRRFCCGRSKTKVE